MKNRCLLKLKKASNKKMFNILDQIFIRVNVFSVEKKENLLCSQQKGLELRRAENCIQAKMCETLGYIKYFWGENN